MVRARKGYKVLFLEVPEGLWYRLQAVAKVSYRTLTAQCTLALEEHLGKFETAQSRELAKQLGERDREGPEREGLFPEARGKKGGRGGQDKGRRRG